MPEPFIPIWLSLGEAENLLRELAELDDTDVGIPERSYGIVEDAIETEKPRSYEQMQVERGKPRPLESMRGGLEEPE